MQHANTRKRLCCVMVINVFRQVCASTVTEWVLCLRCPRHRLHRMHPVWADCGGNLCWVLRCDRSHGLRGRCELNHRLKGRNVVRISCQWIGFRDSLKKSRDSETWVARVSVQQATREVETFCVGSTLSYSSIPGNRNWQIETADWNLDVRLDIWVMSKETLCTPRNIA